MWSWTEHMRADHVLSATLIQCLQCIFIALFFIQNRKRVFAETAIYPTRLLAVTKWDEKAWAMLLFSVEKLVTSLMLIQFVPKPWFTSFFSRFVSGLIRSDLRPAAYDSWSFAVFWKHNIPFACGVLIDIGIALQNCHQARCVSCHRLQYNRVRHLSSVVVGASQSLLGMWKTGLAWRSLPWRA